RAVRGQRRRTVLGMADLETVSVPLSLTTQIDVPAVTRSLGSLLLLFSLMLLAAFWLPVNRLAAPVYLKTLSEPASTIHTSVPSVVIPSGWALGPRLPAIQEPR